MTRALLVLGSLLYVALGERELDDGMDSTLSCCFFRVVDRERLWGLIDTPRIGCFAVSLLFRSKWCCTHSCLVLSLPLVHPQFCSSPVMPAVVRSEAIGRTR